MSAHACTAAISTLSQEAYLFSSDQTRAMAGREYLGITAQCSTAKQRGTTPLCRVNRNSCMAVCHVLYYTCVVEELEFEWDAANLFHVLVEAPKGITPALQEVIKGNEPKFFEEDRAGRSGTHRMIAPDDDGRFWTVILLHRGGNLWRPIAGWPSTNRQIRAYKEECDDW